MPELTVQVLDMSHIRNFLHRNKFLFLKNMIVPWKALSQWYWKDGINAGKNYFCLQTMFVGQTGYGKSSTLNSICGQDFFHTDDISSCTKSLFSIYYEFKKMSKGDSIYLSLYDLPGVGESIEADKSYIELYSEMLARSHCIVYVLRADKRDHAKDIEVLSQIGIFNNKDLYSKTIFALNCVDKIAPLSREHPFKLSSVQTENLNKKVTEVSRIFNVSKNNIVYYSATEHYNVNKLVSKIAETLNNECIRLGGVYHDRSR